MEPQSFLIDSKLIVSFILGFVFALLFDYIVRRRFKLGILDKAHEVLLTVDVIDPILKEKINYAINRNDIVLALKLLAEFAHSSAMQHANNLKNQLSNVSISLPVGPVKEDVLKLLKQGADFAGCEINLWLPEIDKPIEPNCNDLMFAFKALGLCNLSYMTSDIHPELVDQEKQWISAMNVTEYETWHSEYIETNVSSNIGRMVKEFSHKALRTVTGGEIGGAEAITGYISNVSPEFPESLPFVCFRGTQSHSDALNNVISLVTEEFFTHKGTLVGKAGLGMINHYQSLCILRKKYDEVEKGIFDLIVERGLKSKNGILLCGHSLGSATALLLASEIYTDYSLKIPIHLITFGSPRVFDKETSIKIHDYKFHHHMRFINSGDLVTVLGEQSTIPLTHSGIPYVFPPVIRFDTPEDHHDWITIHESKAFDWSLKPSDIGKALLTFAAAEGVYHLLSGDSGYFQRFRQSKIFSKALENLQGSVKDSFMQMIHLLSSKDNSIEKMEILQED